MGNDLIATKSSDVKGLFFTIFPVILARGYKLH